jgi:5-methylcytosine-specific restriction protein A
MPRALKTCSTPSCPELVASGRCAGCNKQADAQRGSRHQRGYGRQHEQRFRRQVLLREPLCVCSDETHGHGPLCLAQSTDADHWPLSRRELVAAGLDPNDPERGRGLCSTCHKRSTAREQPGGWHGSSHRHLAE